MHQEHRRVLEAEKEVRVGGGGGKGGKRDEGARGERGQSDRREDVCGERERGRGSGE